MGVGWWDRGGAGAVGCFGGMTLTVSYQVISSGRKRCSAQYMSINNMFVIFCGCLYNSVGAGITISCVLLPQLLILPLQMLSTPSRPVRTRISIQRDHEKDPPMHIITHCDSIIGNVIDRDMILIPFAIGPLGFGPPMQNFLFWHPPSSSFHVPLHQTERCGDVLKA
jgi:hypothetical protein